MINILMKFEDHPYSSFDARVLMKCNKETLININVNNIKSQYDMGVDVVIEKIHELKVCVF